MKPRAVIAIIAAALLTGCAPQRIDPPLYTYDLPRVVSESARLHALSVGGTVYSVEDTHSMEQLLRGGDLVVLAPVPFDSLRVGRVITYRAGWKATNAPPVTHRIAAIDSGGLILSGDNNPRSENKHRVTAANYIGAVVGIYRLIK